MTLSQTLPLLTSEHVNRHKRLFHQYFGQDTDTEQCWTIFSSVSNLGRREQAELQVVKCESQGEN